MLMASAYANIAMSISEHNLISGSCNRPLVCSCYIDDIYSIWTHGEDKLKDFLLYIGSFHSYVQGT